MVRPPMFSKSVHPRSGPNRPGPNRPGPEHPGPAHARPAAPPPPATRLPTAGGVAALVLLTVSMLILAALFGIAAGLAPARAAGGVPLPGLDGGRP